MKLGLFIFVAYFTLEFGLIDGMRKGDHNNTNKCKCGIRNPTNGELLTACNNSTQTKASEELERVINGDIVNPPYKYPWLVAVYKNKSRVCTGTLISRYYVITAAHCCENAPLEDHINHTICYDKERKKKNCWNEPKEITVAFVTRTKELTAQLSVDQITIHPKYNTKFIIHDMAILHLSKPSPCAKYVRPICLSVNIFDYKPDVEATLIGYGSSSRKAEESTLDLREGKMKSVDKTKCGKESKDDMMCFVGENKQGSCFGDSGAPLTLEKDGINYLIGVLSTGNEECEVSQSSYYSSIEKDVQWIQSQAKELPRAPSGTAKPPIDCKKGK